ncbi:putative nitrate ABC transporter, periplasmic protein [Actinoplanes italicus]|uniref:NitT/TauT family transport system substrate-binding protein n=1 Tax=Actinoplanes italicus TaxID=113567 RepID=A0A2T0JY83_9ACTN|nr:ABC transporter substrate-binding protein [Actinoplanes italicus]PRX13836.1 NitT/TauT family transport system substrate-binding protein [Actinoplanes italicus]GIE36881.1 putative nitrate ABC transporter, periplasmic protein [Actinoplanes italicus]
MRRAALAGTLLLALSGCTVAGDRAEAGVEQVVVGYQSKTINTVTAGTLLRAKGFLEQRLGGKYDVVWQDYDTGAPITAQMMAGKIDIGSMGDYPLLINGARGQQSEQTRTRMIAVTGYNRRGALNTVVVARDSPVATLSGLRGKVVSTSVGSAAHGLFVQALRKAGLTDTDVKVENQQPQVGASALQSGNVDALSQFVAWPGLLVHRGEAKVLYDGGALEVPTLHGTVVRQQYADQRPDVVKAFLAAQQDATDFLWRHPLEAAEIVAKATGLPAEVVYLYNGANGIATFDLPIRPEFRAALEQDVPFLKSIGVLQGIDLDAFVDDSLVPAGGGTPGAVLSGTDAICGTAVTDPALAGELWLAGENTTIATTDPTCLVKAVRAAKASGRQIRAAYVPDATTGTRWFADKSTWVQDGARFLPFVTEAAAKTFSTGHPGSRVLSYDQLVNES